MIGKINTNANSYQIRYVVMYLHPSYTESIKLHNLTCCTDCDKLGVVVSV